MTAGRLSGVLSTLRGRSSRWVRLMPRGGTGRSSWACQAYAAPTPGRVPRRRALASPPPGPTRRRQVFGLRLRAQRILWRTWPVYGAASAVTSTTTVEVGLWLGLLGARPPERTNERGQDFSVTPTSGDGPSREASSRRDLRAQCNALCVSFGRSSWFLRVGIANRTGNWCLVARCTGRAGCRRGRTAPRWTARPGR